jgi:hypothetical protein
MEYVIIYLIVRHWRVILGVLALGWVASFFEENGWIIAPIFVFCGLFVFAWISQRRSELAIERKARKPVRRRRGGVKRAVERTPNRDKQAESWRRMQDAARKRGERKTAQSIRAGATE